METKGLETKVGTFLLLGLCLVGALIVMFGRVGEQFQPSYKLTVDFPNASGLLKGSNVFFAGAPIGRVTTVPRVIKEGHAVEIQVKINDDVKIHNDADWIIGTSGLLGDRYVDVQPRDNMDAPYLRNGDRVEGRRQTGFADLAERTEPLVKTANEIAIEVKKFMHKFNDQVFTEESSEQLKDSFKKLDSVLKRVDELLALAQAGKGPLAMLLSDKDVSRDISALVKNLRKHGPFFYSDDVDKRKDEKKSANEGLR
jgi:phospholipid/cholesterol/gamma-HCH transport system substrate-binding protein